MVNRRKWHDSTNYRQRLNYFDYGFIHNRDQTMMSFESFMERNLQEFFSSAETLNVVIPVSYNNARSVIGLGGAYRQVLQQLSNTINMDSSNKNTYGMKEYHQQAIFSLILVQSTSMQKMINLIKDYLLNLDKAGHEWNVVYYAYYDDLAISLSQQGKI